MHVILRPSAAGLDEIEITEALFAIGRQEPPFNAYDKSLVGKLSRRHARIFEQDGFVYLADLGSLNGTTCNGRQLKHQPVELHNGDEIDFGGLAFTVVVAASELPDRGEADGTIQCMVLTPTRSQDVLEPIVVSSFPFLFDKNSDVFARHRNTLKDKLAYMSRHHAHIFLRDDGLYIEDLGSTNGTYVSGRKLDERARLLRDGDLVSLGTEGLTYSVQVLRAAPTGTTQIPSGIAAVDNPTRTIFVDSPTSFLDVYFVEDREADGGSDSENGAADSSAGDAAPRGLAGQLVHSFVGGPIWTPGLRRILLGVVLLTAGGGALWYWQGRDVRAVHSALEAEDYAAAVALTQELLAASPSDPQIGDLAVTAALRHWVPRWQAAMSAGDFEQAQTVVDGAAEGLSHSPDARAVMTLLAWGTRLRAHMAAPVPADISGQIDGARIEADLLEWWQSDPFAHARTLDRTASVLPDFRTHREQVYSDVRQLRARVLDTEPLLELDRSLAEALAADELTAAQRIIDDFRAEQPQIPGTEVLSEDLDRLRRLAGLIEGQQWLAATQALQDDPFVSAPFAEHGRELAESSLPDQAAMDRLAAARDLWRRGELEAALTEMRSLSDGPWPGFGASIARRYEALLAGFRRLAAADAEGSTEDYEDRLFDYYAGLNDAEDAYLLGQLEREFENHADAARQRASDYLDAAGEAWSSYRSHGGIQPEHRLDQAVSDAFAARANELTRAATALGRSRRIFERIERPVPESWESLQAAVAGEAAFQRGQLENVAFHEPEVQRRMLAMLPPP